MIGERVGSYEISAKLGEGGMGVVYRARDTRLERDVAIKVLPAAFVADQERLARFEREAKLLAQLNHPNIATIHGLEESGDVRALVIELVEGPTLAERMQGGPVSVDEALALVRQIADALEEAHEKGIVHRDLKPQNVKLSADGKVKVLDFGLAKAMDAGSGFASTSDMVNSPTLTFGGTREGVILGTAAYMAPEQARGAAVDKRADIWAFGVVLYEMLAGEALFAGASVMDTLSAVMRQPIELAALPASVPPRLRELLRRCLERDPKRRLRDIGDARHELEAVAAGESLVGAAAGPAAAPSPRGRRELAVAAVALVVGAGLTTLALKKAPPPAELLEFSVETRPARGVDLGFSLDLAGIAISPDGQTIAFTGATSEAGGNDERQLFVRPLDRRQATPLQGTEFARRPSFSSDGRSIVFLRGGGEVFRVDARGGPVQPVVMPSFRVVDAAAAPDDTIVAIVSEREREGRKFVRIWEDGARVETLAAIDDRAAFPLLLPGSNGLVFSRNVGPSMTLEVLDLSTGTSQVLAQRGVRPAWSPTGHLLYTDEGQLFALPFDAKKLAATGSAVPVRTGLSTGVLYAWSHFAVSDNGTLAVVSEDAISPAADSILWMSADGSATSLGAPPLYYVDPRLSPDGKFLALSVPGEGNDVWVHDLVRGGRTRLSFTDREDETPIWSPDGGSVVWSSTRPEGRTIVRRNRDGSGAETVLWVDDRHSHCASWTPDGATILLELRDPETGNDVYALHLGAENRAVPLLNAPYDETLPRLSPDGRWLAYVSDEAQVAEVFMQPYPALDRKVQLSVDGGTQPVWSRDGRVLYFRKEAEIWAVDVDARGAEPRVSRPRLALAEPTGAGKGPAHWGYDVGADGRFLVSPPASKFFPRRLDVVTGWSRELERLTRGR